MGRVRPRDHHHQPRGGRHTKWLGQIEAYSLNTAAGDTLHIDYLTFIPVLEGYGKARGVQPTSSATVDAFDNFSTGTLSGGLNGRTPAVGAAWATSGATMDFGIASGGAARSTVSDSGTRFGVLGVAVGNCSVTVIYPEFSVVAFLESSGAQRGSQTRRRRRPPSLDA
jgi:hypothetical protein